MIAKRLLILFVLINSAGLIRARAQGGACTTLGQTPPTAFPVCGTSTFKQQTVPQCNNHSIPVNCSNANYTDINPYWYKFTCFQGGTLGFEITPITASDDYDWQLFDVTGHDPNDVYTNISLFVSANWSANPGATGASASGTGNVNCAGYSYPNQNAMPTLVMGHNYLLMVSHFTQTQSGYSLVFSGGTASITDTAAPKLQRAQPSCDGMQIKIVLNKKMKCNSLTASGSDFSLSPGSVQISGASGNGCSTGFDMDTVTLTLSGALTPGNYTVSAQNGTDQNTLLDNCGTQVPVGYAVTFNKPVAPQPTPLDSIAPLGCAPNVLNLVFKKGIRCASIAQDGSDFRLMGPSAVGISGASGNCDGNGNTPVVKVKLAAPLVVGGTYILTLLNGNDGNTIIDECGQMTPAGSSLSFTIKDTLSGEFTDQILYGCRSDTIVFNYPAKNDANQWQWIFDNTDTVRVGNPVRIYSVFGAKTAMLIVSNGVCSDTSDVVTINLDNGIKAAFEAPNILCPKDQATFINNSTGKVDSWTWDFGDGTGSTQQTPPAHLYPMTGIETKYAVDLIAHKGGCSDTAAQQIDVLRSCYIAVPSAFTPNGDGMNDYLYPLNALKADNLEFRVFNRYGQLVFESADWTRKWDGTVNGHPSPAGTYVWTLRYTDHDTGKKIEQKGTTILIR